MKNNYIDVNNIEIARVEEDNEIQVYDDIKNYYFLFQKCQLGERNKLMKLLELRIISII